MKMKINLKSITKSLLIIALFGIVLFSINSIYKIVHANNLKDINYLRKHTLIYEDAALGKNIYSVKTPSMVDIYNEEYQDMLDDKIDELINTSHGFNDATIIYNPYGTNDLAFNIYFNSEYKSTLKYTISVSDSDIKDYSNVLYNGNTNNLSLKHSYQIIGFVPGYVNILKLELIDDNGNVRDTRTIKIDMSDIDNEGEVKLSQNSGKSKEELSNGLYTILGNDSDGQDYVFMYDNNGILRVQSPIIGYRAHNILFNDDKMYYSVSQTKIAEINKLGKVTKIFSTGKYQLHHDYTFDDDENLLVLANNTEKDTEEDCIIKINTKTKKVTELADFEKMFKSYVKTCKLDKESSRDEGEDGLDWLHLNSIEYVSGNVILSSRETSSIIKINNINTNPKINYIIADKKIWKDTDFSSYVYDKVGDFKIHAGQHSVRYTPTDDEKVYYLTFFNNNYGNALSKPDFDYKEIGIKNDNAFVGDKSYYYVYKVNEIDKTFELVDSMPVSYSGIVSSVQKLPNNNILVDSGTKGVYAEYDEDKKLIKKFTVKLNKYMVYRVLKYDFNNFWFYDKS